MPTGRNHVFLRRAPGFTTITSGPAAEGKVRPKWYEEYTPLQWVLASGAFGTSVAYVLHRIDIARVENDVATELKRVEEQAAAKVKRAKDEVKRAEGQAAAEMKRAADEVKRAADEVERVQEMRDLEISVAQKEVNRYKREMQLAYSNEFKPYREAISKKNKINGKAKEGKEGKEKD